MSHVDPLSTDALAVAALLQRGLEFYGHDKLEEAITAWREVLRLAPGNVEALDYLDTAGYVRSHEEPSSPTSGEAPTRTPSDLKPLDLLTTKEDSPPPSSHVTRDGDLKDPVLRRLLTEQRFEDALKHLYLLRSKNPRDTALSRSIQLLRERLGEIYSGQLTNLDRIAHLTNSAEGFAFNSEERHIASLVDNISSFGDILGASRLGRVPSLRILCLFQSEGLLTSSSSSLAPPRRSVPISVKEDNTERTTMPSYRPPKGAKHLRDPHALNDRNTSEAQLSPSPFVGTQRSDAPQSRALALKKPKKQPLETPGGPGGEAYEARFAQATRSYLVRDYERAIELFGECMSERPDDPRPLYNLKAIQRRTGKS